MTDRELMHQALEALESTLYPQKKQQEAITALRNRLAKPHIKVEGPLHVVCQCDKCKTQRPWVGLTEPELHEINPTWPAPNEHWKYKDVLEFVRAIEAKLKEKNT